MAPQLQPPPRVVIADDSRFMRRVLRQALETAGLDVVGEAADGDEARRPRPAAPGLLIPACAHGTGDGGRNGVLRGRAPLVVIACSTGGPRALGELLPKLPRPLGAGTLIVQHMPPGFTAPLAARLDRSSALRVREAHDGDVVARDDVFIAPGGSHLHVRAGGRLALAEDEEPVGGLRPRADLTILDAVRHYGERLVLVVLTGMGRDGLDGARAVKQAGGRVLVEAESTCAVYGMPRAVSEAKLADAELALHDLPRAIAAECAA